MSLPPVYKASQVSHNPSNHLFLVLPYSLAPYFPLFLNVQSSQTCSSSITNNYLDPVDTACSQRSPAASEEPFLGSYPLDFSIFFFGLQDTELPCFSSLVLFLFNLPHGSSSSACPISVLSPRSALVPSWAMIHSHGVTLFGASSQVHLPILRLSLQCLCF